MGSSVVGGGRECDVVGTVGHGTVPADTPQPIPGTHTLSTPLVATDYHSKSSSRRGSRHLPQLLE